jgi:hypothetical protein
MKSCEPRRSRDHLRDGTGVAIPPTLRELHVLLDSKVATLPYGSPGPDRVGCSDGYTARCTYGIEGSWL